MKPRALHPTTTRTSTREIAMSAPAPTRCVCAAALERAHEQYGHLRGVDVWVRFTATPTSSYRGILRVLTDRPGYLLVDRGDPDLSRIAHIDDILDVTTEEEKRRRWR